MTSTDKILIKLADALPNFIMDKNKLGFETEIIDDL